MALLNRNTYDDLRGGTQEEACEFLVVENNIGFIIGRKGTTISQIQEISGAKISTQSQRGRKGFAIRGNEKQRARAKELINEKLVSSCYRKRNNFCSRKSSDFLFSVICIHSDCQLVSLSFICSVSQTHSQPVTQSVKRLVNQSINQSLSKLVILSATQQFNYPVSQQVRQSVIQSVNQTLS